MMSTLMSSPDIAKAIPSFAPPEVVLSEMLNSVCVTPQGMGWLIGSLKALDEDGALTGVPYQVFGL